MKALITNNLIQRIDAFFAGSEGHKTDSEFIKLAKRIEGKEVDLVFKSGDAFEKIDNNYWIPDCCYTEVAK